MTVGSIINRIRSTTSAKASEKLDALDFHLNQPLAKIAANLGIQELNDLYGPRNAVTFAMGKSFDGEHFEREEVALPRNIRQQNGLHYHVHARVVEYTIVLDGSKLAPPENIGTQAFTKVPPDRRLICIRLPTEFDRDDDEVIPMSITAAMIRDGNDLIRHIREVLQEEPSIGLKNYKNWDDAKWVECHLQYNCKVAFEYMAHGVYRSLVGAGAEQSLSVKLSTIKQHDEHGDGGSITVDAYYQEFTCMLATVNPRKLFDVPIASKFLENMAPMLKTTVTNESLWTEPSMMTNRTNAAQLGELADLFDIASRAEQRLMATIELQDQMLEMKGLNAKGPKPRSMLAGHSSRHEETFDEFMDGIDTSMFPEDVCEQTLYTTPTEENLVACCMLASFLGRGGSTAESAMRNASGTRTPVACWGCGKPHRFAECPQKEDPEARAKASQQFNEWREARETRREGRGMMKKTSALIGKSEQHEGDAMLSDQAMELMRAFTADDTSTDKRKQLSQALRSMLAEPKGKKK